MALRHLKTTGKYAYRLKTPGKLPLLPTQLKMFLNKYSTTKHTMKCTVKHPRLVSQNSCPRWTDRQQWTEEQHQLIFRFMGDGEAQKVISRYIKQFRPTFTFGIYHHLHRFFGILVKSNTFTIKCHGVRDTPLYLVLNSRVLWFHFKFSLNTSEHQKQHAMTRRTLQQTRQTGERAFCLLVWGFCLILKHTLESYILKNPTVLFWPYSCWFKWDFFSWTRQQRK